MSADHRGARFRMSSITAMQCAFLFTRTHIMMNPEDHASEVGEVEHSVVSRAEPDQQFSSSSR